MENGSILHLTGIKHHTMKYICLALLLFSLELSAQSKQAQSANAKPPVALRDFLNADTINRADSANVNPKQSTIIRICMPAKNSLLRPPHFVFMYHNKIIAETDSTDLHGLPPQDIKAMRVLKGDNAIKKYGEKGRNGVIEVDLKYRKDKKFFE